MAFLDEMHDQMTCKMKTEDERQSGLDKMYRTLRHLYKLLKIEDQAKTSLEIAVEAIKEGSNPMSFELAFKDMLLPLTPSTWIMIGFFYIADSGLLYRKYKKGKITKSQFLKSLKLESIQTLSGTVLAGAGSALGFTIGTIILSGVGSAIGAVVFGFVAGYYGTQAVMNSYERLE